MSQTLPWTPLDPGMAHLDVASIKSFLKLVNSYGLIVRVQATLAYNEPTFYLSKSANHNVGDLKSEGKLVECVFITATNLVDFGVNVTWYDGKFAQGFVGGQRTGKFDDETDSKPYEGIRYRGQRMFSQITKLHKEIKRCLTD